MQISPKYSSSDWIRLDLRSESSWKGGIRILDDRIKGRFLRMVERIQGEDFSGFSVLALDCLLIETLQQFKEGTKKTPRGKGKEYFEKFLTQTSFGRYFNTATAGLYYEHFRCGILHQAEIKKGSKVWKIGPLVNETHGGITVNYKKFHKELRKVFATYLADLRRGATPTLRENFKNKMDSICQVMP